MKSLLVLVCFACVLTHCAPEKQHAVIMTVNGPKSSGSMGVSLIHEHILVDFVGAAQISADRWDDNEVIRRAYPHLRQAKMLGCQTLVECTPAYLGRDPLLLKRLADTTGLTIITNTGYYGAVNNKYIPGHAFSETADQLARRWCDEFEHGIEGTGVKPGFIKISVDADSLSGFHQRLVRAAARAHLQTGLTIASHTGPALPAFEQLELLEGEGVAADAFIWVHAQAEKQFSKHIEAAQQGAWVSLDGLDDENVELYVTMIKNLRDHDLLARVLVSHDAGWYDPAKENGGNYRGYTTLFNTLLPRLREEQFSENEIEQVLVINPRNAFGISIRSRK